MKNKIGILGLFLAFFGMFSCQDAYEIEQPGLLDDETTFRTVNDLQLYLNGLYTSVAGLSGLEFTSIYTDELAPSHVYNGSNRDLHRWVLNSATSQAASIWVANYFTINRATRMIAAAGNVVPGDNEVADYNSVLAQARFLRALAYMNLQSYYTTNMADNSALGVPIMTDVPTIADRLPRATNGEVYAHMEEDLNFALANIGSAQNNHFVSAAAIEALMARMYTYREMYSQAAVHANNAINNYGIQLASGSPLGTLTNFYGNNPSNEFRQIWKDVPTAPEVIFQLKSEVQGVGFQPASIWFFNASNYSGSPIWSMSLRVWDLLNNAMPNDVRRYAYVDPTSVPEENAIIIDKYPGVNFAPLRNNVKLFRLSEMYLILAENHVNSGNLGAAADAVNTLRAERVYEGTAPAVSYASATEAWASIMHERRLEFWLEGHRYVDVRRLGTRANQAFDRSDLDDEVSGQPLTIPLGDHRFTLPIPFAELNANPNMTQNPGY
ncbi:MAG: RagB/SusD family nutrient uptake outer membrane protein [Weeksellaceae bacterium]|nr:RagB/SusD family nutrient uptake outer membrane protein [Weeksellaceae bacterium]